MEHRCKEPGFGFPGPTICRACDYQNGTAEERAALRMQEMAEELLAKAKRAQKVAKRMRTLSAKQEWTDRQREEWRALEREMSALRGW